MRSHILKNIVVLVTVSVSKNRGDSSKLVVIQKASDSRSRICIKYTVQLEACKYKAICIQVHASVFWVLSVAAKISMSYVYVEA